jgi:hypothetical protein
VAAIFWKRWRGREKTPQRWWRRLKESTEREGAGEIFLKKVGGVGGLEGGRGLLVGGGRREGII